MEVNKKSDATTGELLSIEFVGKGEEDFRAGIKQWIRDNLPDMTIADFFDRLMEFRQTGHCSISMEGWEE